MTTFSTRNIAGAAIATIATFASVSTANNHVVLETVSNYTLTGKGNTDANTEGAGFWTPITASGTPWTAGVWFYDSSVYDTDFYDPDMTGNNVDNDTANFDQTDTALSFVIAHGSCDDVTDTKCTTDANCGQGYCPNFPLGSGQSAACIQQGTRTLLTAASGSSHGNLVTYGSSPGHSGALSMALGESPNSGGYDGAATNGGTNVAIIVNSCGFRSRYKDDETQRMFGGVHEIMFHMPVGNIYQTPVGLSGPSIYTDTTQWAARGSTLANLMLTNLDSPASSSWLSPTLVNNSYGNVNGGGAGAGANVVGSKDVSNSAAQSRLAHETWRQTLDDSRDATSSGGGWWYWACNFSNCSRYGL